MTSSRLSAQSALRSARSARPVRIVVATSVAIATAIGTGVVSSPASAASPASSSAPASSTHIYRPSLTKAQIAQYAKLPNQRVIVLLRDQLNGSLNGSTSGLRARSAAVGESQRSIAGELTSLHAPNLRQYHFLNAVSASVSSLEAKRLASDPQVLAVVPDAKVTLPENTAATETSSAVTPKAAAPVNTTPGLCGTRRNPLLEPEALGQIGASTAPYGATGSGVKIAVFPDGLDPNIPDYVRPDGSHAIFDYKDFTGDGINAPTSGGEAFGDASSIIAQGRQVYDLSKTVNQNLPLPKSCAIRIKGVAPGASVAVMKVFGSDSSFNSLILTGMEYAVTHDHVNILSESFGGNPVPNPATDPVALFNALAVKQGITVVVSSGDAGISNTIGTPAASNSGVISTGATSGFRLHAQLSEHGYQLGGYKGWESNNIATLSSGGFTDFGPNTVDVVAPGDSGWANCSTDVSTYSACGNSYGGTADHPPVLAFGGTSEACPLTAATAALVIQAYRQTHKNATPSPVVVKRIITSSANDLNMPVQEQGAGSVNARRAVALARSYSTRTPTASTAAFSPSKIQVVDAPSAKHSTVVGVRNTSGAARTIAPVVQRFSAPVTVAQNTFTYDPASPSTPTFTYWLDGRPEQYVEQDFSVPAGYQRLNVRFGYPQDQSNASQTVFEVLIDPSGKLAQDSDPQGGPLGFGQGDVRNPRAGTWRAIFFSRPGSAKYSGPISYQATVQSRRNVAASVTPAARRLAPGALGYFTVKYATPSTPGDASLAVNFGTGIGILPILTRSYAVPTVAQPATFSGEITTGNGRMALPSQELPYQFSVPAGVRTIDIDVHVADPGYSLIGSLVSPSASPVDVESTTFTDSTMATPTDTLTQNLHLSFRRPVSGRWSLVLATVGGSSSGKPATSFAATIAFNKVRFTSQGIPTSANTTLTSGQPTQASVTVTNTGTSPEIYFIDPRRSGQSTYSLGFLTSPNGTLPAVSVPQAVVPPGTSSFSMVANASKPVRFTTSPAFGQPEILSTTGTTAVSTYSARYVPASEWACALSLIGPFATQTPQQSYSCSAFATTDTIDDTVAATGGNFWDSATDPNTSNVFAPDQAVVVQPGASTTLNVQIVPAAADEGTTVSGYLAVQTFNASTLSGDDLAHIPYTYSVVAPAAG